MKIVTKTIVKDQDGRFLLLKRSASDSHAGYWETCGGGVDEGENLHDSALREVNEESGLNVEGLTALFMDNYVLEDEDTSQKFDVNFYKLNVNSWSNPVKINSNPDHDDFIWVYENELFDYKLDTWTLKHLLIDVQLQRDGLY